MSAEDGGQNTDQLSQKLFLVRDVLNTETGPYNDKHRCMCMVCGWAGPAGNTKGPWNSYRCPQNNCGETYSAEKLTKGQRLLLAP